MCQSSLHILILSNVFTDWADILWSEVKPIEKAGLRVWVSEFGGFQDCTSNAHFTGTWLEGLYQAQMAVQFLSTSSIDQIDLYNITGSTTSLMFQDTSSYWNACLGKPMTFRAASGDLTATGQAYALIGKSLQQEAFVAPVTVPDTPVIRPKGSAPYPSLTGIALTGKEDQWILINLSGETLTLRYPGMGRGTIESLYDPS